MQQENINYKTFLDTLFPMLTKDECIEVRMLQANGKDANLPPIQRFYSSKEGLIADSSEFPVKQQEGYSIYFGVCPRLGSGGNKDAVSHANVLWADLDGKNYSGGKDEALRLLNGFKLKPSVIVDSGHGYHAYWKLKEPQADLKLVESCLTGLAIELHSDLAVKDISRIMRLPGTINNKDKVNPVPSLVIALHVDAIYEFSQFQCFANQGLSTRSSAPKKEKDWIANSLAELKEGSRNAEFSKIIGRLISDNHSSEDAFALLQPHAERCNFPIDELRREIDSMYRRYHKQATGNGNNKKVKYSAYFEGLVDIVEHEGKPVYLVKDNGELKLASQWVVGNDEVCPPPRAAMTWLLPKAAEVIKHYTNDTDKQLYADLLAYHKYISELPGEEYYDLLVAWEFHTYLIEAVQYSPYIYFFAVPERGKSRTGKAMIYVAYRGVHIQSLREAYIIRLANDHKATLFFDVKDIWKMAEHHATEDILLARFEKGISVHRVLYPEKGAFEDTRSFDVFGPTIIATNVAVDQILETRAVQINMPETNKQFEQEVKPDEALKFKERLVAFRARHLGQGLEGIPKTAKGRLGDILRPIHQVILLVSPDREAQFLNLVSTLESDRKIERSMSYEAEVLTVIGLLQGMVHNGLLTVEAIVDQMNLKRPERNKTSSCSVGRRLTAMGFKRSRTSDGHMAIVYDGDDINKLQDKYGVSKPSVASECSVEVANISSISEGSDNSEGSQRA